MTQETINRIHRIYGIVCGAVAVIAGVCFVFSARQLYQAGLAQDAQPYTYETIGAAFSRIAIPVYLCLALVIGGIVLNIIWPQPKKKVPAEKNLPLILARLQAKTDLGSCDSQLRSTIEQQNKSRILHRCISAGLTALGFVLFLSYACNGNNWAPLGGNINQSMIQAVFALLICMVIPCGYCIFTAYLCRRSLAKEIELMRQANAAAPLAAARPAEQKNWAQVITITRYAVLVIAICMIAYGLLNGGTRDVLAKAVAICTECVGLG